jgi:hypothetical protein
MQSWTIGDFLDESMLVDGELDPDANVVDERTLQREHRVRGGSGSGGSKIRRTAKAKPSRRIAPADDENFLKAKPFHIGQVTAGEKHVLYARLDDEPRSPMLARRILIEEVRSLRAAFKSLGEAFRFPEIPMIPRARRGANKQFLIYGLNEVEVAVLECSPGFARRKLIYEAHIRYPDIIRAIDGDAVEDYRKVL